ncbi:MAG TPA: hypothetical protein VFD43_14075 [Planctomycetota bacterium]|nr:hypothetical protein [Planctomycetota bacterium]
MSRRALTAAPTVAATLGAIAALAAPASACPFCSLTQSTDTLVYVAALMLVPYLIVSGVVLWVRRVLASEQE